jgi:Sulfotransferase domain
MKCGTTSLHHYLGEHPQIQKLPAMKETNFFSGPPNGIPYPPGSRRIESLEEYEQLFDPNIEVRGEASPYYTVYPLRKGVPARIKAVAPDVKLIYLVRDPVARAVSQYRFSVSVEHERRSLRDAFSDLSNPGSLYTCPGFYASQLDQYLRCFAQENILVIDQADLITSRYSTLREIFSFLSVDDSFASPLFDEEMNTGRELRTYSRFIVLRRRAQASPLVQRLPRGLRRSLRRSIERVVSQPLEEAALDDDLRNRLRELYRDDVERLRQLTGKQFPTWSV